jgi:hypothetical protein
MFKSNWTTWRRRCLEATGFATTAKASSVPLGTPHTGVDSVATVLKTRGGAKRYYQAVVAKVSTCLKRWIHLFSSPSIGRLHALSYPRYGDQSAAGRLPITYASANAGDGFQKYNIDWIVLRKQRAVLADVFFYYLFRMEPAAQLGVTRKSR